MSWNASTSQMHHRSNHLTLSEHTNGNFQSTEETDINAYTGLFTSVRYLNTMVWLENIEPNTYEESKIFFSKLYLHNHLLFRVYLSS